MNPTAKPHRKLTTLSAIALALALALAATITLGLAGCNDANKTDESSTFGGSGSASSTAKPNTPVDLQQQAEQFAQRLNEQQHAPSPYPNKPIDPVPAQPKPADVQWLDPNTHPADNATATATNATASTPANPAPLSREELIRKLADDLKPRSTAQNAAIRPWLQRASLAVVDPSYELSDDDLKSLSADDRQLVLAWQRTFAQLGRSLSGDDKTDRAKLIELADDLRTQIQSHRNLTVTTMKLCTRVNGYGVYDAIAKPVFLAGTEHPVIVYAELENFRTKLDDAKQHVVQLSQEVVLYNDTDGLPVWRQRPVAINDVSANQRRDFFTVQVIQLSDRLTVGKYILKLRVTDEVGSTIAESSLPVQIVADVKLTK